LADVSAGGGDVTTVLFLWDVPQRLREYLSAGLRGYPVRLLFPEMAEAEELRRLAPDADVMVGWRPTPELLRAANRLRLFVNPGAGVQHLIEMFRALERPVALVNGHGNSYFAAQHAVALLLALTNRVIPHHEWMARGRWRTGDTEAASIPLRGRTIGLLGYGAINRNVHSMLSGFDVRFVAMRRDSGEVSSIDRLFGPDSLHDFLRECDVLVIAVPLTDETKEMIGGRELELLGPTGLLVNVGRGEVVQEEPLFVALRDGVIAGAAIDVWYEYRPDPHANGRRYPYHFPFHELPNVVLSLHRAASPLDDLARWDEVIENICRASAGRTDFVNPVDLVAGY